MTIPSQDFRLGIGMEGLASQVKPYIKQVIEQFSEITYVEIGVAHAVTLTNISSELSHSGKKWRAIGIDLPDGYSLDKNAVARNAIFKRLPLYVMNGEIAGNADPAWEKITVYLKSSHTFIPENWNDIPIQFALIDGCHCDKCFATDFLLLEPLIVPGGIVMTHDIDEASQKEAEPRGHGNRAVRDVARELGIFDSTREDWKMLAELQSQKGAGNMGVFQKG